MKRARHKDIQSKLNFMTATNMEPFSKEIKITHLDIRIKPEGFMYKGAIFNDAGMLYKEIIQIIQSRFPEYVLESN